MARPKRITSTGPETDTDTTGDEGTETSETSVETAELRGQVEALSAQVTQLMAALVGQRFAQTAPAYDAAAEEMVRVENLLGVGVAFTVNDVRTGNPRHVLLDRMGAFVMLQRGQVAQLREATPHFFANGYISAEGVMENPNAIANYEAFLKGIAEEEIESRIEQITSTDTLFQLFNHIESMRFEHADAEGKPLVEKGSDDKVRLVLRERILPSKYTLIERAVQRRVFALSGVHLALDT